MSPLGGRGVGIGWRSEISGVIAQLDVAFCEVIAESLHGCGGPLPTGLAALRSRGVPVVPHGVSLSLGGADGVDESRIGHLASCVAALDAPLASEHIAFVRADGVEAGHLLPVPRTREQLDVLVANIARVQDGLPVPFAVENIAALFDWPDAEFTESEFLTELVERTGVFLLLDVANVYADALNRRRDPAAELARLPTERLAYCHVAGGREFDGRYHDTHTDPVPDAVLALVEQLASRVDVPFLLEIDGGFPPAADLFAQLDAIADAVGVARVTGEARTANAWAP